MHVDLRTGRQLILQDSGLKTQSCTRLPREFPAGLLINRMPVAQLVGTGLATSIAPLTVAMQTAILTLLRGLVPPLFLGLGPQWARFQDIQSDVATNTTQLSLLFDSILPPIWNDTFDTFPEVRQPNAVCLRKPCKCSCNSLHQPLPLKTYSNSITVKRTALAPCPCQAHLPPLSALTWIASFSILGLLRALAPCRACSPGCILPAGNANGVQHMY